VRSQRRPPPPRPSRGGLLVAEGPAPTAASVLVQLPEIEVRLATVEIYDTAHNQLVTAIEILSPVNKREPGLTKYRAKWRELRGAGIHILEIDLLRRGQRPLLHPRIPDSHYCVTLARARSSGVHVWAIQLQERLPILPVPLAAPDADVTLDLSQALQSIYDRAAYDLSIDYSAPPPPPELNADEAAWLKRQLDL